MEQIKQQLNPPPYDYADVVTKARLVQLVAIALQLIFLYQAYAVVGYAIIFPALFHGLAFYHTFNRYQRKTDGRYDLRQALSVQDPALKAQYAFALVGSLLFAVLGFYSISTDETSYLTQLIYGLASYAQVGAAAGTLGLEIFEVAKQKMQ